MSIRRAQNLTITLPLVDATSPPDPATGLSFAAGEIQVSKDGNAFANVANTPAEIGGTGVYSLLMGANEMNAQWVHIKVIKAGVQPFHLTIGTSGDKTGTCLTDAGNTALTFLTDLAETTDDTWKDCLLVFVGGALAGQVKKVSGYNGTTKFITLSSPFTAAPSNLDRFLLINM